MGNQQEKFEDENKVHETVNDPNRKIGIAVIGIGQRMSYLLRILLNKYQEKLQVIAICDESEKCTKQAIEEYLWMFDTLKNVPVYHKNFRKALDDDRIEWVLIGSRNKDHRDHCIMSFELGKNVFCEKPLAITIQQLKEIRDAQRKSGRLFATGFVLRHAPFYKKIKEILKSGELGKLVSIEANELLHPAHGAYIMMNWRRFQEISGPHLLEKCCHDIDILNWIVDSVPSKVASFGGLNVFVPENKVTDDNDYLYYTSWAAYEKVDPFESDKNIVDNQVVILEYRNQCRVSFHTNSHTSLQKRRLLICGTKGTLEADLLDGKIMMQNTGYRKERKVIDMEPQDMHGGADEIIVDDLYESMRNHTTPAATGEEGILSGIVCLAADEARTGSKVVNIEPIWKQFNI